MFRAWSQRNLQFLLFAIPRQNIVRNEFVIKEGELAQQFYIVFEGEFEVIKTLNSHSYVKYSNEPEMKNKIDKFLYVVDKKWKKRPITNNKKTAITILGKGQVFGAMDSFKYILNTSEEMESI